MSLYIPPSSGVDYDGYQRRPSKLKWLMVRVLIGVGVGLALIGVIRFVSSREGGGSSPASSLGGWTAVGEVVQTEHGKYSLIPEITSGGETGAVVKVKAVVVCNADCSGIGYGGVTLAYDGYGSAVGGDLQPGEKRTYTTTVLVEPRGTHYVTLHVSQDSRRRLVATVTIRQDG